MEVSLPHCKVFAVSLADKDSFMKFLHDFFAGEIVPGQATAEGLSHFTGDGRVPPDEGLGRHGGCPPGARDRAGDGGRGVSGGDGGVAKHLAVPRAAGRVRFELLEHRLRR